MGNQTQATSASSSSLLQSAAFISWDQFTHFSRCERLAVQLNNIDKPLGTRELILFFPILLQNQGNLPLSGTQPTLSSGYPLISFSKRNWGGIPARQLCGSCPRSFNTLFLDDIVPSYSYPAWLQLVCRCRFKIKSTSILLPPPLFGQLSEIQTYGLHKSFVNGLVWNTQPKQWLSLNK